MRRLAALACCAGLALAARTAAAAPTPAAPPLRMLFVGIDHYTNGVDHRVNGQPDHPNADPTLHDLNGAVNDVGLLKQTLATAYGLQADDGATPPGRCWADASGASPPAAITLLDACATRMAILGALAAQIRAAPPGGIVLFYFAGHGSSHAQVGNDQLTAQNSTIVPSDAWREAGHPANDILDVELKAAIDAAAVGGVSVVTIFDSCHSGTATRDISAGTVKVNRRSRSAVSTTGPTAPPYRFAVSAARTPTPPYRVHLAAASDSQDAAEAPGPLGVMHGAFTLALTDALIARRGGSYLDIAQQTLWELPRYASKETLAPGETLSGQISQAEGPLATPFLGRLTDENRGTLATVGPVAGTLTIQQGTANLVTPGSKYDVHCFPRTPTVLASAVVTDVAFGQATLKLDAATAPADCSTGPDAFARDTAGRQFWVEETWRDSDQRRLRLAIQGPAAARAVVQPQIDKLAGPNGYVALACSALDCRNVKPEFTISLTGGRALFLNADGQTVVDAGVICGGAGGGAAAACTPDFARRLGAATRAAANYFGLLDLAGHPRTPAWGTIRVFPGGCPKDDCSRATEVRGLPPLRVSPGDVDIILRNTSSQPLHRYALLLSPDDFSVTVLSPPGYSDDPAMNPFQSLAYKGSFVKPGRATLVVMFSKSPINIESLHQEPVRDADSAANTDLERLLLNAGEGQRAPPPKVDDFDVRAVDFRVTN